MIQQDFLSRPAHPARLLARQTTATVAAASAKAMTSAGAPAPTTLLPAPLTQRTLSGTPVRRILETTWRQWHLPIAAPRSLSLVEGRRN